ncbi:hypothetical protein ABZ438_35580 [Streptomyces sp. NPDC005786]|uniref:hypothetical protein n=1 Tax=Streptomyces sp. NPDC005786 TaxID=3154891 RepID=UPI0033D6877F
MIRAGRLTYAQTMAGLAAHLGMPLGTFRNKKPHTQEGHPAPISSPTSRSLLWDSQQTTAFHAGKPVPALPAADDDKDLLDRHEAAAALGVSAGSWNKYKSDSQLSRHVVMVPAGDGGTEHWPRSVVRAFKESRPGRGAGGGRRVGSGDMVPRDKVLPRIAELLDDNPAITLTEVADTLGIAKFPTAQAGLAQLRGRRIADLIESESGLTATQAAERLGYPKVTHRGAAAIAEAELHSRRTLPYLQNMADTLAEAGIADQTEVNVRQLADGRLAAALPLAAGQAAPALVWDERSGWRTAISRRHPIGRDSTTTSDAGGTHNLAAGIRPSPDELRAALTSKSAER